MIHGLPPTGWLAIPSPGSVGARNLLLPRTGARTRRRPSQRGGILWKLLVALFVLLTLASLYLLRAPILREAAGLFIATDELQPANAIILLGDDNYAADRAARAAELFHARWAPAVVASGRYLRPYASIADLMARDLAERNVPADFIVPLRHRASSTREEAAIVGELLRQRRWRRIIVVTSNFHTRRAGYIFRGVLGREVEIRMAAANDSDFDPARWWQQRESRKLFARESAAWLLALWESFRGSTPDPDSSPDARPAAEPSASPVR
jgi:uncharacterized SAM-binding protein YcdF (DUF218 family)